MPIEPILRHDKAGCPWAARSRSIIAKALEAAHEQGITRRRIAHLLACSPALVDAWCKPSHPTEIRGGHLLQLLAREDVLPVDVRRTLLAELASEAGAQIDGESYPEEIDIRGAVMRCTAEVGMVAGLVADYTADGSEQGSELSADERQDLVAHIDDAKRRLAEMHKHIVAK